MAKKKLLKKFFSKRNKINAKQNIPNPFNRFNNLGDSIKEIPLTEKTLLIALLVFIGIVAFSTNSDNLNVITGAAIGPQDLNEKITLVISLLTEGFGKPFFDLLAPTPNILFIKLLLVVVFYVLLSYAAGMRNRFGGKGNIIAGILAFLGAALLPDAIINLYIVQFIPGFISVAGAVLILIGGLYWLFTREVDSRFGHGLKALGYFLAFIIISEIEDMISNALPSGAFRNIVDWIVLIAFIFALIMFIVELVLALSGVGQAAWTVAGERDERRGREREGREDVQDELRHLARNVLDELEDLI